MCFFKTLPPHMLIMCHFSQIPARQKKKTRTVIWQQPPLESIDYNFLEVGHTDMECDNM